MSTTGTAGAAILTSLECDESLFHVTLNRPKGNILDTSMISEIRIALKAAVGRAPLRSVLIEGAGPNFSFGASVEEHRPESAASMLEAFHGLILDLADSNLVLLSVVRGQCLGGGLELAALGHRIFAAHGSKLGSPEIKLGVFAPAASYVLPARIGQARADDLLLTGRVVDASEALAIGLIDELCADPGAAALDWHDRHLRQLSAIAVRHAVRAGRLRFYADLRRALDVLERQYLDELNLTADAREGIAAFLEKRAPAWSHQ
jgi:cyclohexa-1,5-dienecarbonyl-CoA hydratase